MHIAFLRYGRLVRMLGAAAFPFLAWSASGCLASDTRCDSASALDHQACPDPGAGVVVNEGLDAPRLQIGDRVSVAVFEHLDREEDKWSSGQQRPRDLSHSFLQRAELSGERPVQENGAISFPMLGQIMVAGKTSRQLELSISSAFEHTFGRSGFASVLSVEHSPVYIVGPVKNPGSYKYVPGMTVLHVVALAGGVDRAGTESWQAVESVRETGQIQRSLDLLSRTLARRAVLRAERDGENVSPPKQLVSILGEAQAKTAITDQLALRGLVASTRRTRRNALNAAIESARGELEAAKGRLGPIDILAKLRSERLNGLTTLVNNGVVNRTMLLQAQSDLSESQAHRQDALAAIVSAKRRLDQAVEAEEAFALETRNELEIEIATLDREAADNLTSITAGQGVLNVVQARLSASAGSRNAGAFTFEIIRHTSTGVTTVTASDLSVVEPGDLVRLQIASEAREEHDRLAPDLASLAELARIHKQE